MTTNWDALLLAERQENEDDAHGAQIEALDMCMALVEPEAVRTQATTMLNYLKGMQDGTIPRDYSEGEWANRDW